MVNWQKRSVLRFKGSRWRYSSDRRKSLEELEQWLDDHVAFGDCLLFKGSNSMGLSKAVAYMKEK